LGSAHVAMSSISIEDAMPVSFDETCLQFTFLTPESFSRKYETLPKMVIRACKMQQKKGLC